LVSSCKSSLSYLVSRPNGGNVAVIAVGGATEALDARPGALTLQNRLQSIMGIAMPLFHARGVFQYSFGLIPYRKSIHTIVGKPIPVSQTACPSSEDIDALHRVYLQSLMELFEENKTTYGLEKDQHLTFI
ncbi:hypothetical protein GOODEAATRI_025931, partial [Goodea atripinnis]